MATYEVYVGGPATANYSRAMFPAPPFNAAGAQFIAVTPAAHKGPTSFGLTRVIDVSQRAMAEFLKNNALVQGDVLGSIIIPQNVLLRGFYYEVQNASGGANPLTITPSLRGVGGGTLPAIAGNTQGAKGFAKTGASAWVGTNATVGVIATNGADFFIGAPTILDLTLTAMNATSKLGALKLLITPLVDNLDHGQY